MAHTDRDRERWMRHNHEDKPCVYDDRDLWPAGMSGYCIVRSNYCEVCRRLWSGENRRRFYISTESYSAWAKQQRKVERTKLRNQIVMARNGHIDWDDLPSGEGKIYRRPYFD